MRIQFDPEAQQELIAASKYYERHRDGYGRRFLLAVQAATTAAAEYPEAGPRWPGTPSRLSIRRGQNPGFPSNWLVYAVVPNYLYVLAIVHAKRRPGYWKRRIARLENAP